MQKKNGTSVLISVCGIDTETEKPTFSVFKNQITEIAQYLTKKSSKIHKLTYNT